ncbi:MAG: hypothetical protein Ct9H300mP1_23450 [Planctomycetaceae bacterium]|nr:MAG: hypothetical protein Ct9H300mP1_23450 [Planctomycetaceae bacterium]
MVMEATGGPSPGGAGVPVPRDPWNGMLAYKRSLYLFGGVYPRYGPPSGPAGSEDDGVAE